MPYQANHKVSCKDRDRYQITREVVEFENKSGSIVDNKDRGKILSICCASCGAPAEWVTRKK